MQALHKLITAAHSQPSALTTRKAPVSLSAAAQKQAYLIMNKETGALEAADAGVSHVFSSTAGWCHDTGEAKPDERFSRSCRYHNLATDKSGHTQYFSPLGAASDGVPEFLNFERINSPYSEPSCALVMPMPVHFLRGCKSVPSWCANSIFHGLADLVLPVFVMRQMAQLYGDGAPYAGPNGGSPVPPGDALPEYDTNVLFVMDGSIDVTSGQMKGPLVASLSRYDCLSRT